MWRPPADAAREATGAASPSGMVDEHSVATGLPVAALAAVIVVVGALVAILVFAG